MKNVLIAMMLVGAASAFGGPRQSGQAAQSAPSQEVERIAREVYKQIVTLAQYGVFDNIHFAIQGKTVILRGQASRPTLKSSAENVVKKIEGVSAVQNDIEVLPVSQNDDRIRALTYARIYSNTTLSRYTSNRGGAARLPSMTRRTMGITNDPPIGWHAIHIIVKNGNIQLVGVVDTSLDLAVAEMQANSVPGAFRVDNDLMLSKPEK